MAMGFVINKAWTYKFMFCILSLLQALFANAQADNKLIEFRRADAWDIRCVDYGQRGKVTCDLYLVMNYKPHPDFRAVVMKVFLPQPDTPWVEIDFESQSKLNLIFDSAAQKTLPLIDCARSCVVAGAGAKQLVAMIAAQRAVLSLVDFEVEPFEIPIDYEGFSQGLQWLEEMQTQYGF